MRVGTRAVASAVESQRSADWNQARASHRFISRQQLEIRQIDDDLGLMEQSYRLRYQVYCVERGFLNPANYPDQLERDEFDSFSLHAGVVSQHRQLVGTLRLVKICMEELPLFRHCTIYEECKSRLRREGVQLAEVSRLCMSRECRDDQAGNSRVGLNLFRATYQTSKRNRLTHWLAAMEPSLHRLLAAVGVPFRVAGPATDYFGEVAPYMCDLEEFDAHILSGRHPRLRSFLDGLELQFYPTAHMEV
jgi:N-acyl-L-homoserine lactone synthetase